MSVFNFIQLEKLRNQENNMHKFSESDSESENETDVSINHIENQSKNAITSEKNVKKTFQSKAKSKSTAQDEFDEMEFEFFCGDKKNSKVLATVADYNLYSKHGTCARGIRYRCKDRKCRAFVILCNDRNICMRFKSSPPHKHHKTQNKLETDYWNVVVKSEMRRQCTNLYTLAGGKRLASVRSIFSNVMQQYPRSNLKLSSIRKTLSRLKKGTLPTNPKNVHEINEAFRNPEILRSFGYSFGENGTTEKFFDTAVETENFSYCVFSSKKIISMINDRIKPEKRHILLDGTFRTCPLGSFKQLLIIYVRVDHQVSIFDFHFLILSECPLSTIFSVLVCFRLFHLHSV